jgi:hypothetical protein
MFVVPESLSKSKDVSLRMPREWSEGERSEAERIEAADDRGVEMADDSREVKGEGVRVTRTLKIRVSGKRS